MLLEVDNLKVVINDNNILTGVSISLNKGDIYGLLGPNGAGKTTTIFAIMGLYEFSVSNFKLFGENVDNNLNLFKRKIGILPESQDFYNWMKPAQYLNWFSRLYRIESDKDKIDNLLMVVGLSNVKNKYISQFSRGMKQRLALAKALINKPELLILDEPTNGLDPRGRKEIHDLLISLAAEKNMGILFSTHILEDVDRLCNKIGIINNGKTVLHGELNSLILNSNETNLSYKIKLKNNARIKSELPAGVKIIKTEGSWLYINVDSELYPDISALWRYIFEKGFDILEIHSVNGGLEELYMKHTSKNETGG